MAFIKENNSEEKASILEEIYQSSGQESEWREQKKAKVKNYFKNPEKSNGFLMKINLAVALFAFIFGLFWFNYKINTPMRTYLQKYGGKISLAEPTIEDQLAELMLRDTDNDGISDYDEIYIYNTNPYLADTDGDGLTDYEEIFIYGTDPNCPQGSDCGRFEADYDNTFNAVSPELSLISGGASIEELRQALKSAGVPEEYLSQFSNQELNELYNATINENVEPDVLAESIKTGLMEDFKNLSPEEIRQLLAEQGIDQNILNEISDQELIKILSEIE